jgi:hypothetical protein
MTMDRRDFLKTLGLSSIALTLPKPLSIFAAKESDIKAPPLHVGRCEMGPLSDALRRFTLQEIGMSVDRPLNAGRYEDYLWSWQIAFFMRRTDEPGSRVKMFQIPSSMMPDPTLAFYANSFPNLGGRSSLPTFCVMPTPIICDEKTVLEFWWTPKDPSLLPKHPLPKIRILLRGVMHYSRDPETFMFYKDGGIMRRHSKVFWWANEARTVQLDRTRAIEMGLVPMTEPEGSIA